MRVLMLNERDLSHPLAGGVEVHLEEVASRLRSAHDIETTVLCAGFPGAKTDELRRGIRFVRIGNNRFDYYARLPARARAELRSAPHDLLVENLCKLVFLSQIWLPAMPRLGLVHHLFGLSAFRQVSPLVAAFVVATESLLPLAYRHWPMVAVSPSTRDDLVRRGLHRDLLHVIPNGLDHHQYSPDPGAAEESDLVVYVGRVEHYKGVDLLLDAWPSVRAARPLARLEILGAGTALDAVRRRTDALGLTSSVSFRGFVSADEKIAWLRRATVVVQPSRKEGWGLTVLEANACGSPVVATLVPGLRDSVRHDRTGLLVPPGDPAGLAEGIARILADPALRARLARGAREWAARFSWDEVAAAFAEVFAATAAGRPVPQVRDFLADGDRDQVGRQPTGAGSVGGPEAGATGARREGVGA